MTARASDGPGRGSDAPTRTTWTREGAVTILAVLGLALAARLIIAYAFPGTGLKFDLDSFHAWAAKHDTKQRRAPRLTDEECFLWVSCGQS